MKRWPLVASFLLFILLCASIAYWGMQLFKPPVRPVAAPPRVAAEVNPDAAVALFGGAAGPSNSAGNYQLKGVIFSGTPTDSVAILSSEGKPAQAIRSGMEVVPGVTVKEVHRTYVLLSDDGSTRRVDLPEDADQQENSAVATPVPVRPSQMSSPSAPPSTPQQQAAPSEPPAPATITTPQAPQAPASVPNPPPSPEPTQVPENSPTSSQTAPAAPPRVVVSPRQSGQSITGGQSAQGTVQPAR